MCFKYSYFKFNFFNLISFKNNGFINSDNDKIYIYDNILIIIIIIVIYIIIIYCFDKFK